MSIPAPESWEVWHSAVLAYKDWRQRRAAMREIAELGEVESRRALSDCGLGASELRSAMTHAFASRLHLPAALASLGVDVDAFEAEHGETHRALRRTCMLCPERKRCGEVLACGDFASRYGDFCANGPELMASAGAGSSAA